MSLSSFLVAAFLALTLWLGRMQWLAAAQRRAAHAGYLDGVASLFDHVVARLQPSGFARMTAKLDGLAFDLQVVPDSLTFRKLPALWVLVTLTEPLPLRATLDIMTRPTGNEPFSHFASLAHSLACPAFLPDGTALRSDNSAAFKVDWLHGHAEIFHDPRVKEMVISPKGLRLVILAEEADRGRFLLFRDAEMAAEPLDPSRIASLLHRLVALRTQILAIPEI